MLRRYFRLLPDFQAFFPNRLSAKTFTPFFRISLFLRNFAQLMTNITSNNTPHIVRVKDFKIDADYAAWVSEIKSRYHSDQIKATVKVNVEKLSFNWSVGRDLVTRKAEERWGTGVVEQLSLDLQEAFSSEKGFGVRNLWNMKAWYFFFSTPEAKDKLHHVGAELQSQSNQTFIKLHQVGAEFDTEFPLVLGLVPWRHQVNIVTKCKSVDEAMFYIKECIVGGWSRTTLDNAIKANLYNTHGKAISNFSDRLPEAQSRLHRKLQRKIMTLDSSPFRPTTMK